MHIETIAVHAGGDPDPATGAVAPPIHLSTTFEHGPAGEHTHGYIYIRESNPTQTRLETALAALEGGDAALNFASGMGAVSAIVQRLEPGSHVILPDDMYIDFRNLARIFMPKWGIEHTVVNMSELDQLQKAMRPATKLVWLETPSNPLLKVTDIAEAVRIAHAGGAMVVVDSTFATPVLQRPLELGADVVMHSTTKYFGGHSDVQGGALIFRKRDKLVEQVMEARRVIGAAASPFNAWLVLRGLRSLVCRVEKHCANAMALAHALAKSPAVSSVFYPGLESHAGHAVARKQMKAFGGMLSIRVKGGREQAVRAASRVKLFQTATSLGGVESLIEHRASSEGPGTTTPEDLLRLSVGLEHADDLIADLEQALA
ncbi:MAG TPA: aminotransferase class I/II-fold pyridoxal phosphate-dependent enzyme [Terriglobales bacterium]